MIIAPAGCHVQERLLNTLDRIAIDIQEHPEWSYQEIAEHIAMKLGRARFGIVDESEIPEGSIN